MLFNVTQESQIFLSTEHTEGTDVKRIFFWLRERKKSLEEIFFKMLLRKKSV